MGRKPYELIGQRFGRLVVIGQAPSAHGNTRWICKCDCGNNTVTTGVRLVRGHTRSCGCINSEIVIARNKSLADGKYRNDRIYRIYYGMRTRCYNTGDVGYSHYGARGITVCDEWLNDFFSFQKWAYENGYRDDLTIDRIDVNGNYEPGNCRWADIETQANNRRESVLLTLNGKTQTAAQWGRELGISREVIYGRLKKGWSAEESLTIPVGYYIGGKYNHTTKLVR